MSFGSALTLPSVKQLKMVLAWCEIHKEQLLRNWGSAQKHEQISKIEPLEVEMIHTVIQVKPTAEYMVYVYFSDGRIKLFDLKPMIGLGVFRQIQDLDVFLEKCTVMNKTLAWDLSGRFDEAKCLDIDPETIYNDGVEVSDPLTEEAA